jgi:hypothetical protein
MPISGTSKLMYRYLIIPISTNDLGGITNRRKKDPLIILNMKSIQRLSYPMVAIVTVQCAERWCRKQFSLRISSFLFLAAVRAGGTGEYFMHLQVRDLLTNYDQN